MEHYEFLTQLEYITPEEEAAYQVFQYVYKNNNFENNELLTLVDLQRFRPTVLIAFLCATFPLRSKIRSYAIYYQRLEIHFIATLGEVRTEKLLKGLRP